MIDFIQKSIKYQAKKIRQMTYFFNYELFTFYCTLTAVPVIETNKVLEFANGSTSN